MPTREATITEIRWQRPGNPWKRFRTDDSETPIWTGAIGDAAPGTVIKAEGDVDKHPKFGTSFKVSRVLSLAVPAGSGDAIWLAYRIPHVGDERAAVLIDRFGDRLWGLLQAGSGELVTVAGITAARIGEMSEAHAAYGNERAIVVELYDHGLGMGHGIKAYKAFSGRLADAVALDPYCLMSVEGIGFPTADPVALSLGVAENDPRRLRAMTEHTLEEELDRGHCYMERMPLLVRVAKATGAKVTAVGDAVAASVRIVMRSDTVMLMRIDSAERTVAAGLRDLLGRKAFDVVAPELPEWLDDSQRAAVLGLLTGSLGVLTGGPGTGKTTTLKAALEAIEAGGARIMLAAPTGKAAKRMTEVTGRQATTIHKLLQWSPDGWRVNESTPVEADVVVLDESSMIDIELFASLIRGLGHARLILIGDVDQLPPVGAGQPLQDVIASGVVPVHRLTTVHRQAGESWVIDNAAKIIAGEMPSLAAGGGFEHLAHDDSDDIVTDIIRLYHRDPNIQVLTPEHKNGAGTVAVNLAVQEALNPATGGTFDAVFKTDGYDIRKGDKVLYTKNVPDLGLVNGDMGVVRGVEARGDTVVVLVKFDGLDHPDREDGCWALSGGTAHPLTLAYAMTIHKSQGSEWAHVVVVADKAHWSLARRIFYTAVTRTSDKLTVVGSEEAVARACSSNRNLSRNTLLGQRLTEVPS